LAQGTLRSAYTVLTQYAGLVADGFRWQLSESQDFAEFSCVADVELGDSTRFAMEYAMVTARRIGQHFLSTRAVPTQARFRHARPRHWRRYASALSCPVLFDQDSTALTFPRVYLDRPQPHADSMMSTMLRPTAERMLSQRAPAARLRGRLETILRHERDPSGVQLEDMAQRLGITARALRDNLRREGVTLSSLIEHTRCQIACDELRRPRTTIRATAERLGFSQPSAFHRAFRRWTGRTPVEFLQLQGARVRPADAEDDALTPYRRRA
jgi:AraC-like DNA-binding protein